MKKEDLAALLKDMSLEEKIHQLLQLGGQFYAEDTVVTGPMKEQGFTEKCIGEAGSIIGVMGAEKIKEIQKTYMEKQPHHIPALFMLDVINGLRTIFPIPLAQGATFEPKLSERCASIAAKESAVSGVHVTFAPMVDVVRDARWGRVMESPGEDTLLNSKFAEAMVRGFQGESVAEEYKVAACIKHFAAYGAPDGGREYNTVELSDHTLYESYLPPYKAGIDAGSELVMTSFNTINGIPASGNRKLMRQILREEMEFDGVLISDYAAIEELIYHGYAADRREAAKRGIEAGVDIDMMTGVYISQLGELVKSGEVKEELIDEAVLRILQLKNKLGLFENPYKDANAEKETKYILCQEHREAAREMAAKSFVLLKNNGVLPLKKEGQKIAFIGPYAEEKNLHGAWSFLGDSKDTITIRQAAEEVFAANQVTFAKGCPILEEDIKLEGFGEYKDEIYSQKEKENWLTQAIEQAKEADVVVLAIGEHRLQTGESACRADICVPKNQLKLFRKIKEVNQNIIVVLFNGRPLDLRELETHAAAVLEVWFPGTEGGHAIIDVLTGNTNPSGKLSMSFPYCTGQVPVHYNEFSTGRPHVPGRDKDRFRSKYLDIPNAPLYPFGYGLSYTEFTCGPIQLDGNQLNQQGSIKACVLLKNIGKAAGTEVVQLYIQDVSGSVVRPVKELKDFQKVTLIPGEEREVSFTISEKDLRFYREDMTFGSEPGLFRVYIGTDSNTENQAEFTL